MMLACDSPTGQSLSAVSQSTTRSWHSSTSPDAGSTGEELYECADYAQYHAKRHARGTTIVFNETHEPNFRQLRQMLGERRRRLADRR